MSLIIFWALLNVSVTQMVMVVWCNQFLFFFCFYSLVFTNNLNIQLLVILIRDY